jgi:transcriptional regulator with XRE-family HTH domain
LSQTKLSESVGLTFQQIQKYERGTNRISSSRLYEFAKVLDVPVSYFFDEMPSNALRGRPVTARGRKGFGEARLAVQAGEGSADQARDAGTSAGLQQDR